MRETVLFAPGANGTELLRSLAGSGINTLGYRIYGAVDLARTVVQRHGYAITQTFLPRKDEPAVIDSFLREIPYFSNASYADAESMAAALYTLRSLIPTDEKETLRAKLPEGEFPEKNLAILQVYERYLQELDKSDRIDTVGLVRKAIGLGRTLDAEIMTLQEYPLSPLEEELARKLSGGAYQKTALPELFQKPASTPEPASEPASTPEFPASSEMTITEGYGASNEVRDILHYIFTNQVPLDRCTVAITETISYAKLFSDLADEYGIPMTFGCGLPITVSNPARLLKLYQTWNTSGFRGIDALTALVMNSAFDRKKLRELFPERQVFNTDTWTEILKTAGSLRLSANREKNQEKIEAYQQYLGTVSFNSKRQQELKTYAASCLPVMAGEMEKGPAYLIANYSRIRDGHAGRLDRSAVEVITGMITAYQRFSGNDDIDEIIPAILQKTVSSENSREGHLHICGIRGALAVPREYLFAAGLSAVHFPGSPTENYLLLDSDLEMFGAEEKVPTSSVRVSRNRQSLYDLLALAAALGSKIRLSYSSYDPAELKDANPSSVLQEIFSIKYPERRDKGAFESVLRHAGFFDDGISIHTKAGAAYMSGNAVVSEPAAEAAPQSVSLSPEREYSPSDIDLFFECPKHFYLAKILRIEEPETDDPFEVIHANEIGTMAHALMEELGASHMDKAAFLKRAREAFTAFLKSRPPVHEGDAQRECEQFADMMANAWEQDPKQEIQLAEEMQHVEHSTGIRLKGIPDRMEKTEDGKYLIVDFKTGRRINHQEDDPVTCLQVLIYAYMMEQAGFEIKGCEYRYLRSRKTIPCRYDDSMKEMLSARLAEFKEALLAGSFPCTEEEDNCRWCRLSTVCGRKRKEEEEGSDE